VGPGLLAIRIPAARQLAPTRPGRAVLPGSVPECMLRALRPSRASAPFHGTRPGPPFAEAQSSTTTTSG
jgi:hypothetical protein